MYFSRWFEVCSAELFAKLLSLQSQMHDARSAARKGHKVMQAVRWKGVGGLVRSAVNCIKRSFPSLCPTGRLAERFEAGGDDGDNDIRRKVNARCLFLGQVFRISMRFPGKSLNIERQNHCQEPTYPNVSTSDIPRPNPDSQLHLVSTCTGRDGHIEHGFLIAICRGTCEEETGGGTFSMHLLETYQNNNQHDRT